MTSTAKTRETRSTGKYLHDNHGTIECRVCGRRWWWAGRTRIGRNARLSDRGILMCPEGCTRTRTDRTKARPTLEEV